MGWPATSTWRNRVARLALALLPLLMGVALVYVGDHWLSEVVGGYLLGAIGILVLGATGLRPPEQQQGAYRSGERHHDA